MPNSLQKKESQPNDSIKKMELEIAMLEKELSEVEKELTIFESQIRSQLHAQIIRIRELALLYKAKKSEKKAKRLEQKKKGKNYKEPQATNVANVKQQKDELNLSDKQELKRLYKEAIVKVHPDKHINESDQITERANELTVQLNDIYQGGDLEELKGFYEHIISGNAMSHIPYLPESIADPKAMLVYLKNKKEHLIAALEETKASEIYVVLKTYEKPLSFIEELRIQFEQRICQLEKRTKKK